MRRAGRPDGELPGGEELGESVGGREAVLPGHEGRLHSLQERSRQVVRLTSGEHGALLNRENCQCKFMMEQDLNFQAAGEFRISFLKRGIFINFVILCSSEPVHCVLCDNRPEDSFPGW